MMAPLSDQSKADCYYNVHITAQTLFNDVLTKNNHCSYNPEPSGNEADVSNAQDLTVCIMGLLYNQFSN